MLSSKLFIFEKILWKMEFYKILHLQIIPLQNQNIPVKNLFVHPHLFNHP